MKRKNEKEIKEREKSRVEEESKGRLEKEKLRLPFWEAIRRLPLLMYCGDHLGLQGVPLVCNEIFFSFPFIRENGKFILESMTINFLFY